MFNIKKIKVLNRDLGVLKDYIKDLKNEHKSELERLRESTISDRKSYRTQITALEVKNSKLDEQLSVYKDQEDRYTDLLIRETKVEMTEDELSKAGDFLSEEKASIEKKIADAKKEAENLVKEGEKTQKARADKQYENGYADGVADGLRKVHEITADDRRMAMQIGALSAASHTPGAADEIAKSITASATKGLGDGKK